MHFRKHFVLVWAAVTEYHRLGDFINNINVWLTALEDEGPRLQCWQIQYLMRTHSWFKIVIFSLRPHAAEGEGNSLELLLEGH